MTTIDLLARICRCVNEHRFATGSARDVLEDMMHDAVAELSDRMPDRTDGDYEYAWREDLRALLEDELHRPTETAPLHTSRRKH